MQQEGACVGEFFSCVCLHAFETQVMWLLFSTKQQPAGKSLCLFVCVHALFWTCCLAVVVYTAGPRFLPTSLPYYR